MPYLRQVEVAERLGRSVSWLRKRLAKDRQSVEPSLQVQHYVGRTPLWTHDAFQQLRGQIGARHETGHYGRRSHGVLVAGGREREDLHSSCIVCR
jgi:hypothetical protein